MLSKNGRRRGSFPEALSISTRPDRRIHTNGSVARNKILFLKPAISSRLPGSTPTTRSSARSRCIIPMASATACLMLLTPARRSCLNRTRSRRSRRATSRRLELLRAEQVRVFPGVPFQFDVLAASAEDVGAAFRDVKWCVSSGDVLSKRTFERFLARTGHPIRSLYGSTEAGSIAMDVRRPADVQFGSLGTPLKYVNIEVRGANEIWVKSPTIPPDGYDNRPEINAAVFRDGYYNTGDVGKLDERGRLIMTGRKQSFFDVGGYKVDLAEVEEVLHGNPKVREAAVVGVEIPNLGGVIKAVVAAHEVCREADILDHCRRHLAAFKVPRFVEFREALPRSAVGKVLRKELSAATSWLTDVPSAREIPRLPRTQQIDWLGRRIQEQVAWILRREPSAIPCDVPFQSLGFDSLRAIELQERLSQMSGVALSITTLWNYTSIEAYAPFLLDAMQGSEPQSYSNEPVPLDSFSDEEIAEMLARELNMSEPESRTEP